MMERKTAWGEPEAPSFWLHLGKYREVYEQELQALEEAKVPQRIWGREGALWKRETQAALAIEKRLGWLELPDVMRADVLRLKALAMEVQTAGLRRAVLLGMGGSSLAPEVLRRVFGVAPGYLDLDVLDTTDPAQIRQIAQRVPLEQTLFLVASKSGTTVETLSLYAFFREALIEKVGERWAKHFVAITDPGTPLEKLAREAGFRAIYLNPSDVGGRYSALSLFGLVPGALLGVDLDRLLEQGKKMAWACRGTLAASQNPAVMLGTAIGALSIHASPPKDKLTFLISPHVASFGAWLEQLIAESTGKEGKGILPVEGENLSAEEYGDDRFFVYLRLEGDENDSLDALAEQLLSKGYPVALISLADPYDLGAEFFRWEFATAVAGYVLGINPFDQPNVEAAKMRAREALARYEETRALPEESPLFEEEGVRFYGPFESRDAKACLQTFWRQSKAGYIALLAYVARQASHEEVLQRIRHLLGSRLRLATTVGFGPRYLHSTGQLHKGGPNTGLFLLITQEEGEDLPIPGKPYSFGLLKRAQALGDLQALREKGRRVLRIHLGVNVEEGLQWLYERIVSSLE
ncbi:MAG: hypothetical protein J7M05_04685 [Anaerolineae bacterium]|nr:hypothetical protein [Anaerolineae bacterium]